MRLTNPLIDTPGMSDPHALVTHDSCYFFTGHDVGFGVNDWVMPDWRIYRFDDLLAWTHVGTISPADNYMGANTTACWAGDIAHANDMYYWFFSDGNRETGVMVAFRPESPYRDALGGSLVVSFEPTVFIDDDRALSRKLESPYAHCDSFVYQGSWYHVWCRYHNRRVDRIRDCFIAPVTYDAEGNRWDILDDLPPFTEGLD